MQLYETSELKQYERYVYVLEVSDLTASMLERDASMCSMSPMTSIRCMFYKQMYTVKNIVSWVFGNWVGIEE